MSQRDRPNGLRQRMAYEAARIMVQQDLSDFDRARRKAAERTGILDRRSWPANDEIQEAILTQRRLFSSETGERELRRLRSQALRAMEAFRAFSPRLLGSALARPGRADRGVQIFLFADCPEDVVFALMEQRIPWHERERPFRYSDGERHIHPVLRFVAGDIPYELIVLPRHAVRNPPLDPVTERPERGTDIAELERLLVGGGDLSLPVFAV
jgi:hypothetical protein